MASNFFLENQSKIPKNASEFDYQIIFMKQEQPGPNFKLMVENTKSHFEWLCST